MHLLFLLPLLSLTASSPWSPSTRPSGRFQSPIYIANGPLYRSDIHLISTTNSSYVPLKLEYPEWDGEYTSRQMERMYELVNLKGGFSGVEVGKSQVTKFELQRIEVHTPVEHHLNGRVHPLEIQLIHTSSSGATGILSLRYSRGDSSSSLLEAIIHDSPISIPRELGRTADDYYFYSGSVTTPPCGEGVTWFILQLGNRKPLIASDEQIRYFASMGEGAGKAAQHINDRPVYHFLKRPEAMFLA